MVGIVEMNPTLTEARKWVREEKIPFPSALDPGEKVGRSYRLEGHPTAVVIDRRGIVRFVHTGFLEGEEALFDQAIRAVLAGQDPPREAP